VLGVNRFATLEEAEIEYRRRAKVAHPDNGGSAEHMAELNAAIAEARRSQAA
jgi:curved DNA-binding protein CbpA